MGFVYVEAQNVRNLVKVQCEPDAQINVIDGPNASGKSSFLEAIGFLGLGRSFRTSTLDPVIRRGAKSLQVFGRFRGTANEHRVGVERSRQGRKIRIDDNPAASAADLVQTVPLMALNPDSHRTFFLEAPVRRQVLAWSLFHVEPQFFPRWRVYMRLLKQRNAALRAGKGFTAWERDLSAAGEALDILYKTHINELSPRWVKWCHELAGITPQVDYDRGWEAEYSLEDALEQTRPIDRERGFTRLGPHRADISVRLEGQSARSVASHGQQKLALLAFRFTQAELVQNTRHRPTVLLIDDLPTDLDQQHRRKVMEKLRQLPAQSFVTATERELLPTDLGRAFHVEQGVLHSIT